MPFYVMICDHADNGLHEVVNGNNNNNNDNINRDNATPNETIPGGYTNENDVDADTDTPGAPILPPDSDPQAARAPERPVPWSEMIIQTVHTFYSRGAPIPAVRPYVAIGKIEYFVQ